MRNYDVQTARWVQQDPFQQFASPYIGMGNNPVSFIDPDGGESNPLQFFILQHFLPGMVGAVAGVTMTEGCAWDKLLGAGKGFGAGLGASYLATGVNWGKIGGVLDDAGKWVSRVSQKGDSWILLRGDNIFWYVGNRIKQTYRATSGYRGPDINGKFWDLQVAKYQNVRDGGPVPEGDYFINLVPDPSRMAKADPKSGQLLRPIGGGIERVPKFIQNPNRPGYGWSYNEWGENRAHLEPIKVWGAKPSERDFSSFYLHDSHKGYSHGCCEVETELFQRLRDYRSTKNKRIKVEVRYPSLDHKTNGGTKF